VERSTLGTAGFNREIATVARIKPTADAAMIMMRRLRFFAATPLRGTSMDERLGENPAGRTIVSSFVLRCGITLESKLANGSTKFGDSRRRAEQWCCGRNNDRDEQTKFADEITPCFPLKVIAADAVKGRRHIFAAACMILAEPHRLIIGFNQWKAPAVMSCW
jgi:hypothetical protein